MIDYDIYTTNKRLDLDLDELLARARAQMDDKEDTQ